MVNKSNRKKLLIILGISAFVILLILGIIMIALKDTLFKSPEKIAESHIANAINDEFSIGTADEDYVIYELQEDGTYKTVDYSNPAKELSDLVFSKMTYEVVSVSEDSCVIHIKAPNYKLLFCDACGIDPETYTLIEKDYDPNADYISIMINAINSGEFEYIESDITVPLEDGKPQLTYEVVDAFYGNMYSFTEELFDSNLG